VRALGEGDPLPARGGAESDGTSASREAVACVEQALSALSRLPETPETIAQGIDLRFDLHSALIR